MNTLDTLGKSNPKDIYTEVTQDQQDRTLKKLNLYSKNFSARRFLVGWFMSVNSLKIILRFVLQFIFLF